VGYAVEALVSWWVAGPLALVIMAGGLAVALFIGALIAWIEQLLPPRAKYLFSATGDLVLVVICLGFVIGIWFVLARWIAS
jgi:hypothetical protein